MVVLFLKYIDFGYAHYTFRLVGVFEYGTTIVWDAAGGRKVVFNFPVFPIT